MQVLQEVFEFEGDRVWTAASGFGGGMGRVQLACGALTGAVIALGLIEAQDMEEVGPKKVSDPVRPKVVQLIDAFEERFGATDCRALTGFDFRAPGGYDAFRGSEDARAGCKSYIQFAVQQVASRWAGQRDQE